MKITQNLPSFNFSPIVTESFYKGLHIGVSILKQIPSRAAALGSRVLNASPLEGVVAVSAMVIMGLALFKILKAKKALKALPNPASSTPKPAASPAPNPAPSTPKPATSPTPTPASTIPKPAASPTPTPAPLTSKPGAIPTPASSRPKPAATPTPASSVPQPVPQPKQSTPTPILKTYAVSASHTNWPPIRLDGSIEIVGEHKIVYHGLGDFAGVKLYIKDSKLYVTVLASEGRRLFQEHLCDTVDLPKGNVEKPYLSRINSDVTLIY